jgi:hypothetical protein
MTGGCCCACHVGGAYRPACDIPGGRGHLHVQAACPTCEHTPCLAEQSTLPGTERCILTHRTQPCRPRRTAAGLLVCEGHRARTWRQLAELAPLHTLLGQHTAAGGAGPRVSGTPDQRIPYHERAAALRRHIRHKLGSWVLAVCEERDLALPKDALADAHAVHIGVLAGLRRLTAQPRPHTAAQAAEEARLHAESRHATRVIDQLEQAVDVEHIVAWLARHHEWLLAQTYVDDYAQDLGDLHSTAWSIAYPSGRRRVAVAPCHAEGCTGRLLVAVASTDDQLPDATCDTDHTHTVPPRAWLRYADAATMLTAVELSAIWGIPVGTIHYWAHQDRWPRDGRYPTRYNAVVAWKTYNRRHPGGDLSGVDNGASDGRSRPLTCGQAMVTQSG